MQTKRRRIRRWSLRLFLLCAALLVAIAGIEWLMRRFDLFGVNHGPNTLRYRAELLVLTALAADGQRDLDGTLFRHKPDVAVDFGRFTIRTNNLGLRGPPITTTKPDTTYRIVVLGDSVVLGWGVDDDQTFSRRLEAGLQQRGDDRHYEVINTGHLAYDTMQEAALLEREAIHLAPDAVLLVFVTNDIVEPTFLLIEALLDGKTAPAGSEPTFLQRLAHHGQLWLPAWTALATNLAAHSTSTSLSNDDDQALSPDMVPAGIRGWERSQQALRRIRDLCRARGVPFLVLDHTLPRLPVLATFCAAEGVDLHEFRFTPDELGLPIYNSLIDTHANALGNELLLQKLIKALAAAGLPTPR